MPHLGILGVEDNDIVLPLYQLHSLLHRKKIWRRPGPALIAWVWHVVTAFGIFPVALHNRGGFGPENRIGVVAHQWNWIAVHDGVPGICAKTSQIDDRTWSGVRRFEIEHVATPRPREIGRRVGNGRAAQSGADQRRRRWDIE